MDIKENKLSIYQQKNIYIKSVDKTDKYETICALGAITCITISVLLLSPRMLYDIEIKAGINALSKTLSYGSIALTIAGTSMLATKQHYQKKINKLEIELDPPKTKIYKK